MRNVGITVCLLLALHAPAFARQGAPGRARLRAHSADSYARARAALEAGLVAHGGVEAMRAAGAVWLRVRGHTFARNQSVRVDGPSEAMKREETLYIDQANRRYLFESEDYFPGDFPVRGRNVIDGEKGLVVDLLDRTVRPAPVSVFNTVNLVRRVPHLFLLMAYEEQAATLRWVGGARHEGRPHDLVSFVSPNGIVWTLFFDARTRLLSKCERFVSDNLDGDAAQETLFEGYRRVGRLQLPARRVQTRAGEVIEDVEYQEVRLGASPPAEFAKPEGFLELPAQAPAPPRETKLAEGVYLFESPGANSLVVEFADHLLVAEPYAGGRGAKAVIAKAKELFPGKPVRYVVVTHHHDDHAGGVRSYVAEGAGVVTTPANRAYFERMAAATFTVAPDEQTRARRRPTFALVEGKRRVFGDGARTVEVLDIGPSPHAAEMLVVYLPKERLIFQGDLLILPASGAFMPSAVNQTTLHFYDWLKRRGLDVERVAGVHGPLTTMRELEEAVRRKRGSD